MKRKLSKERTIALLKQARSLDVQVERELQSSALARDRLGSPSNQRMKSRAKIQQLACQAALDAKEDVGKARAMLLQIESLCWQAVMLNEGLVRREAARFHWVEPDDAQQVARIGALQAAWRFDPERGVTFYTFARWWVRAELSRQFPVSELAAGTQEFIWNIHKLEALGITDVHDIADWFEVPVERVRAHLALEYSQQQLSLDSPIGDEGQTLLELLAAEEREGDDVDIFELEKVLGLISELPTRTANILEQRFGLGDVEARSLAAIAQAEGVTRERIRQVQARAIRWIRDRMLQAGETGDPPPRGAVEKIKPTVDVLVDLLQSRTDGVSCKSLALETGHDQDLLCRLANGAIASGRIHARGDGARRLLFYGRARKSVTLTTLALGESRIDLDTGKYTTPGSETGAGGTVSLREIQLLRYLAARPDLWVTPDELCAKGLGHGRLAALRNAICAIRRRFEVNRKQPKHLEYRARQGYRLTGFELVSSPVLLLPTEPDEPLPPTPIESAPMPTRTTPPTLRELEAELAECRAENARLKEEVEVLQSRLRRAVLPPAPITGQTHIARVMPSRWKDRQGLWYWRIRRPGGREARYVWSGRGTLEQISAQVQELDRQIQGA